jgi:hypothetical protein
MSNRSLIEFNHDCWPAIEDDPIGFAGAVLEMSRAGGTPRAVDALERYGVTYVGTRHHSEKVSVEYKHHKVTL